jgi:LmbE family N-acetylglucosaminyl deacetylase
MAVASIPSTRSVRRPEAERAAAVLGAELILLDIPPIRLVADRRVVRHFDQVIERVQPDLVYTHWNGDSHQDHNVVATATIAAARKNTCALMMYEQTIPGGVTPLAFHAQSFVDITLFMPMKMESIAMHKSQVEVNGELWVQGVRGRAMYRGYQINCEFAEAFEVVKECDVYFKPWKPVK